MLGPFGPKSDKIGAYRAAFVRQVPFEKELSSASRVINEVVLAIQCLSSTRPQMEKVSGATFLGHAAPGDRVEWRW